MAVEETVDTLLFEAGWSKSVDRQGSVLPFARREGHYWIVNGRPNGSDDHVGVAGPGAEYTDPVLLAGALIERARQAKDKLDAAAFSEPPHDALIVVEADLQSEPAPQAPLESAIEEPAPEPQLEPEPQIDPRDAEIEALRARIEELEDANYTLKDALSNIEDELEALHMEPALPSGDEKLEDHAEQWDDLPEEIRNQREGLESLSQYRKRIIPQLNDELARLINKRGLLGSAMPAEDTARLAEVERLLGILARVGEA